MNTCYIICALDCKLDFVPDKSDMVIGADRGCFVASKNNYKTDVAIGDFDSYCINNVDCENIVKFPVKKDDTDSSLAIDYAIEQGYKKIVVYGAIGGALDHTIANISLVAKYIKNGIEICFADGENALFGLHSGESACFSKEASGRISVFSFTDSSSGVYEKGLLYLLDNVMLKNDIPLGVSNEFIGKESEVSVAGGTLLIYTSKINYEKYLTKKSLSDIL